MREKHAALLPHFLFCLHSDARSEGAERAREPRFAAAGGEKEAVALLRPDGLAAAADLTLAVKD